MEVLQYSSLAQILVHTSYGFRRIVNKAIELTQKSPNSPEAGEAQHELFLAFSRNMRGAKVNTKAIVEWLVEARLFP